VFLEAISMIPRDLPLRAYIVGGAVYRTDASQRSVDELLRRAAALGVADRVGFTGFVDDTAGVMRSLDIVVHASTRPEPFGLVVAEAMACGCAVVASAAGGAADLVDEGVDGLTHSPGNARALAHRIIALVTDGELRLRLGAAAQATARRRFDHRRLAGELVPVYRTAVEERWAAIASAAPAPETA
jgi:glycosyltransferase involved in cell wall biosynthesis